MKYKKLILLLLVSVLLAACGSENDLTEAIDTAETLVQEVNALAQELSAEGAATKPTPTTVAINISGQERDATTYTATAPQGNQPGINRRYITFEKMAPADVDVYTHLPTLAQLNLHQQFTIESSGITAEVYNFRQDVNLNATVLTQFLDGLAAATAPEINITNEAGALYDLRISKNPVTRVIVAPYDSGYAPVLGDNRFIGDYPSDRMQGYTWFTASGAISVVKLDASGGTLTDVLFTEMCNGFVDLSPDGFYPNSTETVSYVESTPEESDAFCNFYGRASMYTSTQHVTTYYELLSLMSPLTVFDIKYLYPPSELFNGYVTTAPYS